MKTTFIILFSACAIIISVNLALLTRRSDPRTQTLNTLSNVTNRLRVIHSFVAGEFWTWAQAVRTNGAPPVGMSVEQALHRLKSYNFNAEDFKLQAFPSTNVFSWCINPDSASWNNPERAHDPVAMYYPANLNTLGAQPLYAGITFNGKVLLMSNLPNWKAFEIDSVFPPTKREPASQ